MKLWIDGTPVTQGSKRPFLTRPKQGQPKAVIVETGRKRLKPWRSDIREAVKAELEHGAKAYLGDAALTVTMTFILQAPKKLPKGRTAPNVRPDLDKLCRAVADAITGLAYRDDAQICEMRLSKQYGEAQGLLLEVEAL